jgi:hypothetical protein
MAILKSKTFLRMAVVAIIMTVVLWMMPTGLISAEGSSSLTELKAAADLANMALADAQAAADTANADLAGAQTAADAANLALADAQAAADLANTALTAANDGGIAEEIASAQTAADAANLALADAQAAADTANADLAGAQTAADAANLALADAQTAADAANAALAAALNQDGGEENLNPPEGQEGGSVILNPALSTDKEDYHPEETVILTGTGFAPNAIYTIAVTRPDGSVVIGDGSFTPGSDTVLTDASGNFTYNYILDGIMGLYRIDALDANGLIVVTKTFTDCNAKIQLYKFWDKNNNGTKDGSDTWLYGADFQLYIKSGSSWGSPIATETSDSNGYVHFHIYNYGTYKVVESDPPSGYSGSFTSGEIVINSGNDESTISLGNVANITQTGTFTLTKNFTGGSPYPNAYFYLKDGSGNYYKTTGATDTKANAKVTINTNGGTALWSNLPQQTYYLEEDAISGYSTDNSSSSGITVDSGHLNKTRTVTNTKIVGSVYIEKHGLEGVEYSWADKVKFILDGPGGLHYEATLDNTDHTGLSNDVTWNNLPIGNYILTQSYSGLGNKYTYTSDLVSPYNFTIDAGHKSFSFDVHNCAQKGDVKFTKTGLGSGITAKFKLIWVGADGVPGGSDDVQFDGEQSLTGPGSPHVHWYNVPFGTYYITESVVPSGYQKMADITGIVIDVVGEEECRTGNNVLAKGSIEVTKSGMMAGDLVSISLKKGAALIETKPAGGNGVYTFSNLDFGTDYSIAESYASGNNYTYTISSQIPANPITVNSATKVCVTLVNDPTVKSAKIIIIKNVYGTLLASESFSFTNSQGSGFTLNGTESPTPWRTGIIVEAGKTYTIAENDPGADWTTTWGSTIPGAISGTSRDVTFTVNGSNIAGIDGQTITFDNTRKKCEVTIDKTIGGAPAAEGTFGFGGDLGSFALPDSGLYSKLFTIECGIPYTVSEDILSAGYTFGSILSQGDIEVVSTSGSSITFIARCYGTSKTSQLNTEVIRVEVAKKITFNNNRMPGFIRLTKTDSVTGAPVAGAEYWVFDSNGVHVETLITGSDGSVTVSGFAWGTYTVKEMSAPAGYLVDPTIYTVVIGANSTTVNLSVKNSPTGGGGTVTVGGITEGIQVLAFTGVDPIIPIAGGSAVIVGLAILLSTLRRRAITK